MSEKKSIKPSVIFITAGLFLFFFSYLDIRDYKPLLYDDPQYLSGSQSGDGNLNYWKSLFSNCVVNLWHPFTKLTHDLSLRLFGLTSAGHHIVNALLHCLNAVLIYTWLSKLKAEKILCGCVSLIWFLHPTVVESVSWISGRKDLLVMFFCLLCLISAIERPRRISTLVFAIFAMLSKPTGIMLPALLVLQDCCINRKSCWNLKGISPLIKCYFWIILCSLLTALLTIYFQQQGGQGIQDSRSFFERSSGASWAFIESFLLWINPSKLHIAYENPANLSFLYLVVGFALMLIFIYVIGSRKTPLLLRLGAALFFLFLLPTLGFIRAGNNLIADRYLYLAGLGLTILLLYLPAKKSKLLLLTSAVLLIPLTLLTKHQRTHWKSTEALFQRVISIEPGHAYALAQLGDLEKRKGNKEQATVFFQKALNANSESPIAHLALGDYALVENRHLDAYNHFLKVKAVRSKEDWLHETLAKLAWNLGEKEDAREHLEEALLYASSEQKKVELNQVRADFERSR